MVMSMVHAVENSTSGSLSRNLTRGLEITKGEEVMGEAKAIAHMYHPTAARFVRGGLVFSGRKQRQASACCDGC